MQKNALCSCEETVKILINFCSRKKKNNANQHSATEPDKKAQAENELDSRWAGGRLSTGRRGGSPGCWCWWCGTGRCRSVQAHHHFCWTSLEFQHCLGEENKTKIQPTNQQEPNLWSIYCIQSWLRAFGLATRFWQSRLSPRPSKPGTSGHGGTIPALFHWSVTTAQTYWLKIKRSKTRSALLHCSFAWSKKYQKVFLPALQPPARLSFLGELFSENHSCEWSLQMIFFPPEDVPSASERYCCQKSAQV